VRLRLLLLCATHLCHADGEMHVPGHGSEVSVAAPSAGLGYYLKRAGSDALKDNIRVDRKREWNTYRKSVVMNAAFRDRTGASELNTDMTHGQIVSGLMRVSTMSARVGKGKVLVGSA
jgi:hypothetical protein